MPNEIYENRRLIFGCGNPLFGDDGFGAEVIRRLESAYPLPADVAVLDVGTAIRDILFDLLLSGRHPDQLIIVDAMTIEGAAPGDIREIGLNDIQPAKIVDFSLHQFPTTNLLKELQSHTNIDVRVLVVHPADIPPEVHPGLSEPVQTAVPRMCERILALLQEKDQAVFPSEERGFEFKVGAMAKGLGVHRNTVTNWIKSGKIRAQRTIGKKYRIRETDLSAFCQVSGVAERALRKLMNGVSGRPDQEKDTSTHSNRNRKEATMSQSPIGSVLVVGGGIAGIQATLDLADAGYFVHMVEKTAGIGGVMAQLDKTYPTNDCAM